MSRWNHKTLDVPRIQCRQRLRRTTEPRSGLCFRRMPGTETETRQRISFDEFRPQDISVHSKRIVQAIIVDRTDARPASRQTSR